MVVKCRTSRRHARHDHEGCLPRKREAGKTKERGPTPAAAVYLITASRASTTQANHCSLLAMYLHITPPTTPHVPECPAIARLSPQGDFNSTTTDSSGDIHYSSSLSSPINTSLTREPGEPVCLCGTRPEVTTEDVSCRIHRSMNPAHSYYSFLLLFSVL